MCVCEWLIECFRRSLGYRSTNIEIFVKKLTNLLLPVVFNPPLDDIIALLLIIFGFVLFFWFDGAFWIPIPKPLGDGVSSAP